MILWPAKYGMEIIVGYCKCVWSGQEAITYKLNNLMTFQASQIWICENNYQISYYISTILYSYMLLVLIFRYFIGQYY